MNYPQEMISPGWIPSGKNYQPSELNAGVKGTSRDIETTLMVVKTAPREHKVNALRESVMRVTSAWL